MAENELDIIARIKIAADFSELVRAANQALKEIQRLGAAPLEERRLYSQAATAAQQRAERLATPVGDPGDTVRRAIARLQQASAATTEGVRSSVLNAPGGYSGRAVRAAEAAIGRTEMGADVQEILNANREYAVATERLARARAEDAARMAEFKASDDEYRAATQRAAVARREAAAKDAEAMATPEYAAITARLAAARQETERLEREALAVDANYISNTARVAMAREEQAARVSLARGGYGTAELEATKTWSRSQLLASAAAMKRAEADNQAAAKAEMMIRNENGVLDAAARRRFAETQLNAAIRTREREEMRAAIKRGEMGGTTTQRLMALMSPSGRPPTDFPQLGQMLGQKALTTAGYTLGGFVSGAALFGTIEAFREASKLQESFAGLRGQMDALGQSDAFVRMRDDIKGISNETGVASSEVTKFTTRLLGVFDDPQRAIQETTAAMKLQVVSGTDLNTMLEEMVPVMRAFNVSAEEMGDLAVYIHDNFGIAEEQTLHFFGETAASAEEAGFSLTQLGIIGAAAANSIGKSMTVTGEQFTKILGTMMQNQSQVIAVFRRNPATQGLIDPIIQAYSEGNGGQVFQLLLQNYDKLDRVQQDALIRTLGTRREWALLNGLFQHSSELLADLNSAQQATTDGAGGLNRRFEEVSGTLQRNIARVKELFKNLVEGVLSSGVGQGLALITAALEKLLQVANVGIAIFNALNDAMKFGPFDQGVLLFIAQLAATLLVARKAWQVYNEVKAFGGRTTELLAAAEAKLGVAATGSAAAEDVNSTAIKTNTTLKQQNLVATGETATANVVAGEAAGAAGALPLPAGLRRNVAGRVINERGRYVSAAEVERLVAAAGPGAAEQAAMTGGAVAGGGVLSRAWAAIRGRAAAGWQGAKGFLTQQRAPLGARFGGATSMAGPAVAMAISGLVSASSARDWQLEGGFLSGGPGLLKQEDDLRKAMRDATTARVKEIAANGGDWLDYLTDRFQAAFFDVEMPADIAQKELERRKGGKGRRLVADLTKTGKLGEFIQGISDTNRKNLENFLKQGEVQGFAQQFGLLTDQGTLDQKKLEAALPDITKLSENGDAIASAFLSGLQGIYNVQGSLAGLRDRVADALKGSSLTRDAVQAAGGIQQFLQMQYDPQGAMEIGAITISQYRDELDRQIQLKQATLNSAQDPAQAYKELNALIMQRNKLDDELINRQVDRMNRRAETGGANMPKAERLQNLLRTLGRRPIMQQLEQLPNLLQASSDAFEEELSKIQDPWERYRRAVQGVQIAPETQSLDLQQQAMESSTATEVVGRMAAHSGRAVEEVRKEIADQAVKDGITFKEAAIKIYQEKIRLIELMGFDPVFEKAILAAIEAGALDGIDAQRTIRESEQQAQQTLIQSEMRQAEARLNLARSVGPQGRRAELANTLKGAQQKLAGLQRLKAAGGGGENIDADIIDAQAAVNDALRDSAQYAQDVQLAMMEWAVVEANGDPVAENAARLRIAQQNAANILARTGDPRDTDYIKALQEIRGLQLQDVENQNEITRARMELDAFGRNRDPEQAARDALAQAEFARDTARGDAARLQAELQIRQAQRQIEEAIEENLQADAELAATLMEVRGDTAGAIQRRAADIQRRMTDLAAAGLSNTAAYKQLVGELAQLQRQAVDDAVQTQEELIDFQLEMGQVTIAQAIAGLQALLQNFEVNSKEWQSLMLRIRSLQQQAEQDVQFNLPTQLGVPTLYEARRFNQLAGMGVGYQDNRNVGITINVNGAQDPALVAQQVTSALQSSLGTGATNAPAITIGGW